MRETRPENFANLIFAFGRAQPKGNFAQKQHAEKGLGMIA